MAARPGPKPKPTALRVLSGDAVVNPYEPKPRAAPPTKPPTLSAAASVLWDDLVPALERLSLLTEVDSGVIESYCEAHALVRSAAADVAERGHLVTGARNGETVRNPSVGIMLSAIAAVRHLGGELGLTPSARSRMVVSGSSDIDAEIEALFSRPSN